MCQPLRSSDLKTLEGQLTSNLEKDRHYWQVNAVKCDAVHTAKTYEEFSDRVAAAHLKPLEKKDALRTKPASGWNPLAAHAAHASHASHAHQHQ